MEKIWHYSFDNELGISPEDHPCLLTEAAMNPKNNREKKTNIIFETFNVPKFYVALQDLLSMYASGRTSGMILHSGDGVTSALAVYEGYAIPYSILRNNFAGNDLNYYMMRMYNEEGTHFDHLN